MDSTEFWVTGMLRLYTAILLCVVCLLTALCVKRRADSEVTVQQKLCFIGGTVALRGRYGRAAINWFVFCGRGISLMAAMKRMNTQSRVDSHDS